jgi:hypothetical protein
MGVYMAAAIQVGYAAGWAIPFNELVTLHHTILILTVFPLMLVV